MTLLGVEFTDTINVTSVLLVVIATGLALAFTVRSNVASTWRANYEALKVRADEAEKRVLEERELKHAAISEAAALKLTRDITPLLRSQQEMMDRLLSLQEEGEARYGLALREVRELFAQHEDRAQERHEAQIAAMGQISQSLKALNQERR